MRVLLAAKATVNTQNKVVLLYKHISHNMLFTLFSSYVQSGQTPVWKASFNGHQKCLELLIDAGANVDVLSEVSVSSCTHISETTRATESPHVLWTWSIDTRASHVCVESTGSLCIP